MTKQDVIDQIEKRIRINKESVIKFANQGDNEKADCYESRVHEAESILILVKSIGDNNEAK